MRSKRITPPNATKKNQALKSDIARLMNSGRHEDALKKFKENIASFRNDSDAYTLASKASYNAGNLSETIELLEEAIKLNPENPDPHRALAYILYQARKNEEALPHIEKACQKDPSNADFLSIKGLILSGLDRYKEAIETHEKATKIAPNDYSIWNNYGNSLSSVGRIDDSIHAYKKAVEKSNKSTSAFSNLITSVHYSTKHTKTEITSLCKEWNERYAPKNPPDRPTPKNQEADKKIRIGMFSDGFRNHPAGQMTIAALEKLKNNEIELYLYSTSHEFDYITMRFQKIAKKWKPIEHMDDASFAQSLRDDEIDILIDLSGHNSGTKMLAVAMQPAPIIVKWVGGLINTTGIKAIDYLISDNIETPEGCDEDYVEKLIRLPGDYICYDPPAHAPEITQPPAIKNGFITFGCFNNATKVNEVVLSEWAKIMHLTPSSKLFLKSLQYNTPELRERIISHMLSCGISNDRLILEGPSPHGDLLKSYNKIDIALDPWPYSGGLTTCEALLMGVPVVTLPGPTFAGRHSATHLVNAGMPELVVNSWDEYRARVLELASDLDSLATIRTHLRDVLLQSPVCDAPRFAQHFSHAMRAIWQRYCEGKAPAALRIDTDNRAWFEDERHPMQLQIPQTQGSTQENDFQFNFEGKIITLDHGGLLLADKGFTKLQALGAFACIAFDPASNIKNAERLQQNGELHYYPHVALGNGKEDVLYACLDPTMSSTLEPFPAEYQLPNYQQGCQTLAKLPITTLRLDDIEGLDSIDWLLLDNLSNSLSILENGEKTLAATLLVQARVNFVATHKQQPELTQISHWLSRHGFNFYRLHNLQHRSQLGKHADLLKSQATQLVSADALFIPDQNRLAQLPANQRMKLAFILHTVYGMHDLVSALLHSLGEELERSYLIAEKFLTAPQGMPATPAEHVHAPTDIPADTASSSSFELPKAPHMSEAERALFKKALSEAKSYFEFGSGGSTVWAVRAGLTVKGVESDASWVNALKQQLGEHCQVEAVDIGPTREWGYPISSEHSHKFANYSHAIKTHDYPFDLILVDGRFRVACTATTIQHILDHHRSPEDARIFIHDFWDRPAYHLVLDFLDTLERVDTAGVFKLKPGIKRADVEQMLKQYVLQPA